MAKVLIADDEENLQNLLQTVLEDEGHQVATVGKGDEVIPALQREKPDLLILDVMLPGMDGLSLQKCIDKDPVLHDIPIVVVTAQKAFLGLFDSFPQVKAKLAKPFDMKTLIATVSSVLEQAKASKPA